MFVVIRLDECIGCESFSRFLDFDKLNNPGSDSGPFNDSFSTLDESSQPKQIKKLFILKYLFIHYIVWFIPLKKLRIILWHDFNQKHSFIKLTKLWTLSEVKNHFDSDSY